MSASDNVILAKARAMYGNCLKTEDFSNLLSCHSVSEIAAYLKRQTAYATILKDINEATIHRGHLEMLLRRRIFEDYASLGRYDLTVGSQLSEYLIRQGEVTQLLSYLRMLSAGRPEEFFFSMPLFFASHSRLDCMEISHCKSYTELLDALSGTPFKEILAMYPPGEDGRIRVTEIENALQTRLIETLFSIIDRTSGELKRQLTDLCGVQIDAQNVSRIVRLKKYFDAPPDTIRANLLPSGRCLSPRIMDEMLEAPSAEAVLSIFFSTSVGRRIPEEHRQFVHDLYHRAPYFNARHHIHFSSYAMVVLISYVIITEVEVDDITNIIEGIRYDLPPEQIKPMLLLI